MRTSARTTALLVLFAATAAFAGEVGPSEALLRVGDGAPLTEAALGSARAGDAASPPVLNRSDLNGTVTNNSVAGSTNGANVISDSAFRNAGGFPVVIQNSGNNVLIQNSVILNLSVTP